MTNEEILEAISSMSVLELSELVKAIEDKFGVSAAAPVAVAAAAAPAAAGGQTVEAPMPGKILNIKVSEGQAVKFGEVVVIMEAMKMETEIVAPADGTVSKILVKAGDSVDTGAALVALN